MQLVESFGLGTSASRMQATAPTTDDKSIFEELLRTAEHCYGEIDSVFEANGLGKMETSYRDAQIKIDDAIGTYLEIIANKVMPFDMEATATAVWQHMTHSMQNIPLRFYYEKHPQVRAGGCGGDCLSIALAHGLELGGGCLRKWRTRTTRCSSASAQSCT